MKTPRTIVVPGVFCICVSWLGRLRPRPVSSCGSSPALWQGSVHTGPGLRDLRRRHPHTSSGGTSSPLWTAAISAVPTPPPLPGQFRRGLSCMLFGCRFLCRPKPCEDRPRQYRGSPQCPILASAVRPVRPLCQSEMSRSIGKDFSARASKPSRSLTIV